MNIATEFLDENEPHPDLRQSFSRGQKVLQRAGEHRAKTAHRKARDRATRLRSSGVDMRDVGDLR